MTPVIDVLFFGSLQDLAGTGRLQSEFRPTPADLITLLGAGHPALAEALRQPQVMVAIDQIMAGLDSPLTDGCEVAFMPPVTGG